MKLLVHFIAVNVLLISLSCNKEKKNPLFGDYNTIYTQIIYPNADTGTVQNQLVSVSYFTNDQIVVNDYYMYQSGNGNYYTGGDVNTDRNWSLQYFPEEDSIEFRWNQYNSVAASTSRYWRGRKVH
jgi:hypothetical protein